MGCNRQKGTTVQTKNVFQTKRQQYLNLVKKNRCKSKSIPKMEYSTCAKRIAHCRRQIPPQRTQCATRYSPVQLCLERPPKAFDHCPLRTEATVYQPTCCRERANQCPAPTLSSPNTLPLKRKSPTKTKIYIDAVLPRVKNPGQATTRIVLFI